MPEDLKKRVHILANCMQAVLGYMELGYFDKALEQMKNCAEQLGELSKLTATFVSIEKKEITQLPPATHGPRLVSEKDKDEPNP